jgi:type II secretory pathway component PulM
MDDSILKLLSTAGGGIVSLVVIWRYVVAPWMDRVAQLTEALAVATAHLKSAAEILERVQRTHAAGPELKLTDGGAS